MYMAFLPGLLAAGMSSGFLPGLIQKAGGLVSNILSGLTQGRSVGDSLLNAGKRAIHQFVGIPSPQSEQGAALQDLNLSNQLPIHVPDMAINRMQPKDLERTSDNPVTKYGNRYASEINPRSAFRSNGGFNGAFVAKDVVVKRPDRSREYVARIDDRRKDRREDRMKDRKKYRKKGSHKYRDMM